MTNVIEALALNTAAMSSLVEAYNNAAMVLGEKPVNRFSDRKAALRRIEALYARIAAEDAKVADQVDAAFAPKQEPEVTRIEAALAPGAEKQVNCRRALDQKKGRTAPKAAAPASAPKKLGRPTGSKLILKSNKDVRAKLTAKGKALGGSRLLAEGFADYSAFLNGVPLDKDGNATVTLIAVTGKGEEKGRFTLSIEAGTAKL